MSNTCACSIKYNAARVLSAITESLVYYEPFDPFTKVGGPMAFVVCGASGARPGVRASNIQCYKHQSPGAE